MPHFDALVIGSGISSLVCAALLAKKGKRVCVLERHYKLGGYLHCFERFGCNFDTGAHYVGGMAKGQPFRTLLEYLGAFDETSYIPLNSHGFDTFKFPSFEYRQPVGYKETVDALATIFPRERAGIAQYFDMIRTVARMIPTYEYDDTMNANQALEYLNTPLSGIVDRLTDNQQLKCVLYASCTLHAVHPDDTPFAYHAVMTDSLLQGAYGFTNGGDRLADALMQSIKRSGGIVLPRQEVTSIQVSANSIVRLNTRRRETYSAEWIISGLHPKTTFDLVGHNNLPASFVKRLAMLKESIPFMGAYAACRDLPQISADTNYYVFASEDARGFEILRDPTRLAPHKPVAAYVVRNSRSDIAGKRGFFPLTIHAPVDYRWFKPWAETRFADRPPDYHAFKEQLAQTVYQFVGQNLNLGSAKIAHLEVSTPLSNIYYNGSEEGSAYGIYHGFSQTGMRGYGPRTHISNLLLTGQNTLFPGLLGSAIAGLRTAGHILGIKSILRELKQLRLH